MADTSIGNLDADVIISHWPPVKGPGCKVSRVVLGGIAHRVAAAKAGCSALVQSLCHLLEAEVAYRWKSIFKGDAFYNIPRVRALHNDAEVPHQSTGTSSGHRRHQREAKLLSNNFPGIDEDCDFAKEPISTMSQIRLTVKYNVLLKMMKYLRWGRCRCRIASQPERGPTAMHMMAFRPAFDTSVL